MLTPISFSIGMSSRLYYKSSDLFLHNPNYYYGCTKKQRAIIQKKSIPVTEYLYANLKLNEWKISTQEYKKAQLLISANWAEKYIIKQDVDKQDIDIDTDVSTAPNIIYLTEDEKFRDINGNTVEIEVRGERNHTKIYFSVKDIIAVFELPRLHTTITALQSSYEKNEHYKYFFIRSEYINDVNEPIKKDIYLTYKGLIKVLFSSRSGCAEIFQDWAMIVLFASQLGTDDQRIKVAANIIKTTPRTIKSIFSKSASQFPCIYLILLGKVSDLRNTFEINPSVPDDTNLYKYGLTNDLPRRMAEHDNKYGKMKNVDIIVSIFQAIDPQYLSNAELDIKEECVAYSINLQHDEYKELIYLNDRQFIHLKRNFGRIGRDYSGHTKELTDKIKSLEEDIKEMFRDKKEADLVYQLEIERERNNTLKYKSACETQLEIFQLKEENYRLQIKILTPRGSL